MKRAVITAEMIKKYTKKKEKKKIVELKKQNKASTDWLRRAEYLDTKDLDAIKYNYIFINSNKKNTEKTDTDIA